MIVIGGVIIGALLGAFTARKRGGRLGDILQYAAVYAILLGLTGMIVTIVMHRLAT